MAIPAIQAEAAAFLRELVGRDPVETHISAVFLGEREAFKLKKAVDFGFLDFTTLAERARLTQFEHALNAPHAPGLYLGAEPLTRGPDGTLRLGGEGEPVEWVLRMTRLPPEAFFQGALPAALLDPLADAVVALHATAPKREGDGRMARVITGNREAALSAGLPEAAVRAWAEAALTAEARLAPWLAGRAAAGLLRRCHGDLHLGNICLIEGRPIPFDALEFDEALATIDVGYDLAFLLMDLDQRDSRAAANRLLNRYIARTGDVALLRGLPLWLSLRALIRAHVAARSGQDGAALLAAARTYLDPAPPRLAAVGGLQGTGKSHLARRLAPDLGPAPGAVILRSDEIRKRQAGVAPETRLPAEAYAAHASAAVFAELNALAAQALAAGHAVIADAVFQRAAERDALATLGHGFTGFWLEAPLEFLAARITARKGDASDATPEVLATTAARDAGEITWHRLDATGAPEEVARKILDLPPQPSP
ncbi:AAA family ATPase [Roseococcus sp. SDR]|uniref:bifunctional aminoglycoside phosphotransferase/ATP-binding protein n=1 Tax=Roseococcus sp. SDR TaxID=2835532 RepID=UPI001BD14592|nr:AAA family ATPase [Roseococcus sp. SDR]MBS7788501.1 AAA family ATPase [Roseococcus sp. SDR]MBV1843815.1 AAA family ATPase [Roseococcus sp. SDR]